MCGIAGIYSLKNRSIDIGLLRRMSKVIAHRGPDDHGYVLINTSKRSDYKAFRDYDNPIDSEKNNLNLGFGHRRLSIIDLSEQAHQPMCNEDATLWIVCNGEIYNFIELKEVLKTKGHVFKSRSDTEVIIHSYEEWGLDCLNKFNGMWAFALWDERNKRLICARDRFGIKPFYYNFDGQTFVFASEIKSIIHKRNFDRQPNDQIICDYLVWGYTDHTEETFFKEIKQIPPSHYMIVDKRGINTKRYWDISTDSREVIERNRFLDLFKDSVRLRLRSDVSVGSCLSGGLDSSSVVCMMNNLLSEVNQPDKSKNQKTFSACWHEPECDESKYIRSVIEFVGSEGHCTFPKPEELIQQIDKVIWHQEEPFNTTSIYAQWSVMRLARDYNVKVLLDGQGGDELLGGYRLFLIKFLIQLMKNSSFKRFLLEYNYFRKLHNGGIVELLRYLIKDNIPQFLILKIKKIEQLNWINKDLLKLYLRVHELPRKFQDVFLDECYDHLTKKTLPALLHYEDRNSMAFSIESRLPFLDYRLVEFVFGFSGIEKIKNGLSKWTLREAMRETLPERILSRTDKIGFDTPQNKWFRSSLRGFISDIFNSEKFMTRKYFNPSFIRREFDYFCNGKKNIKSNIWRCISLELWLRKFFDN